MKNESAKLEKGAKAALIILHVFMIGQFVCIYENEYELNSPLIPQGLVWEINKHFVLLAFVFVITSLIGLLLFYFRKYLLVIIIVIAVLIAGRFI